MLNAFSLSYSDFLSATVLPQGRGNHALDCLVILARLSISISHYACMSLSADPFRHRNTALSGKILGTFSEWGHDNLICLSDNIIDPFVYLAAGLGFDALFNASNHS